MEYNEEKNKLEQAEEAMQMAKQASQLAANLAAGNYIGALKNALNLVKNKQFKKAFKMALIKMGIGCIMIIIIATSFLGIINTIKDAMISFYANTTTAVSEAWRWLTDDYWINLEEEIETDPETGEKYTIVDKYVKDLGSKGVSLEALRLLGDADYSDEENLLKDKDNKELVEKYIAEFIRADIITQQPHRRRGTDLISEINQNKVDGGVYFYRTKEEPIISENQFEDGSNNIDETIDVTNQELKQMDFIEYNKFMERLEANDPNLRYKYTIDEDTGELVIVKITKVVKREDKIEVGKGWFYDLFSWINAKAGTTTDYKLEEQRISYKEYISKYTMPYEFLINLCQITENPEFVYHVALLARDTKIILAIQDNTTIEVETIERETEMTTFTNRNGSDIAGASEGAPEVTRTRTVVQTTVQTPVLRIEYADTWSFYEEFEYTKNIKATKEESEPIVNEYTKEHYKNYILAGPFTGIEEVELEQDKGLGDIDSENAKIEREYTYYQSTLLTKSTTTTQLMTKDTTYNEAILKNSVEKSKQFLGLLRNSTGKCDHNCFQEDTWKRVNPLALECAQHAEFDRQGIDVKYRIPNMTKIESPLDNLLSGLDMLYSVLQSNTSGYEEDDKLLGNEEIDQSYNEIDKYIADEDYESAYVVKMQGLVEHLRHLMTFPENEVYTIKDLILENLFGDNDYDGEILSGYDFWWPLDPSLNYRISSDFGYREKPKEGASTDHEGIDIIANGQSIAGVAIIASADGVVKISKFDKVGYGNYIVIDHENGFTTRYGHNAQNLVSVGERVTRGQVIGYVGSTGNSTGPHLHFEIRLNGEPQNPLNYVSMTNKQPTLDKVTIDDATKLDTIYAIVASECATSYEGALAVITCVLNRCESSLWAAYGGSDPYAQITFSGQFSYGIADGSELHKRYLNGNAPEYVKQAVDDALNNGKRNHDYTSFRTDSERVRIKYPFGKEIGGNWYFN